MGGAQERRLPSGPLLPAGVHRGRQASRPARPGAGPPPRTIYRWSLLYDPAAQNGDGAITATLGDESVVLRLKPGQRKNAASARLDHFGVFSIGPGGQVVKLYLDDLRYTARAEPR